MIAHPSLADVVAARDRIASVARVTPLRSSEPLSEIVGHPVWLKVESEQVTGSFKVRGAANALLQLSEDERGRGVVVVSSGNHGRAVAHVARELGIEATICLSSRVPSVKVDAIAALGARIVVAGPDQDDADTVARRLVEDEGRVFIHPFDDERVIAGQGTIALEILDELEPAELFVPLSGGGLAGGIALAVAASPVASRVIGVSQDRGPAMVRSLEAGQLVDVIEEDTLADALAGGLGPENHHSFELCRDHLADTVIVAEEAIADAMAWLYRQGVRAEGGGAVGVAALLSGVVVPEGPTVVVISGGNVATDTLESVMDGQ